MTNFSKQFTEDILLPDGSVASSVADVDKYLRQRGVARASDYSPEYIKRNGLKNIPTIMSNSGPAN